MKSNKNKRNPLYQAIGLALAFSSINVQAQADTEEEDVEKLDALVVTGSKIRTDEVNDTVPIQVIMARDAIARGLTSVGQVLRESTLASGSSQVTAATSTAFVQNGGAGTETLSLRGLGANRTLVLLNGRRAGPAGTRGAVSSFDFNTIPLAAVDRIEILKDGSSSIYGSDAIAGVVNVITKTGDTSSVDVFTSQPTDDGGERSRISGSWGRSNGKGSIRLTFDYDKQTELTRGQRDFFACGEDYYFQGDSNERADIIDPRTGEFYCNDLRWGQVWLYDYGSDNITRGTGRLAQFDYDGNLGNYLDPIGPSDNPADFQPPPGWFLVGGRDPLNYALANADHPFQDLESLVPESTRMTAMLTAEYELSDNLNAYAEVLLNRRETITNEYRQFWSYIYNESFLAGNSLSTGWTGSQWLSPTAITDHFGQEIEVNYSRFVAGLTGVFADDWYWDASVQHSRSDGDYTNKIIYNDSIKDQNFLTGSCVGMTTSVRGVPCIDIPWLDPQFLAGNISQEVRDFIFGVETGNTLYEQTTVEATISSDLFQLPHGSLAAAFGFQYQHDGIYDSPGEQTQLGNTWGQTSAGITKGAVETYAVFAEIQAPLLADLPMVRELNLSASVRYTDVPDAGSGTTFKTGLAWHLNDELTIRGSVGTSFRAPALFELFLNDQTSFLGQRAIDPCINWGDNLADSSITQNMADNCAADGIPEDFTGGAISATVITGGGFGVLESETSESSTWGVVWRPDFADLSISLDYFDFLIEGEVAQLGAANILFQCYNSEFFESDPLCNLFTRDRGTNGDLRILEVRDSFLNIAEQRISGWDFRADYATDIPWGTLIFSTEHTYQKVDKIKLLNPTPEEIAAGATGFVNNNGVFGDPKHTATFSTVFERNNWHVTWFVNYIGGSNARPTVNEFVTFFPAGDTDESTRRTVQIGSSAYHTLSFGYNHEPSGISGVIGVRNIGNKVPPKISRGTGTRVGNSAFYSQYDLFGRSIFLSMKYDF